MLIKQIPEWLHYNMLHINIFVTGRRQITKVKANRWLSLVLCVKKQCEHIYDCMHHGPVWIQEIN